MSTADSAFRGGSTADFLAGPAWLSSKCYGRTPTAMWAVLRFWLLWCCVTLAQHSTETCPDGCTEHGTCNPETGR